MNKKIICVLSQIAIMFTIVGCNSNVNSSSAQSSAISSNSYSSSSSENVTSSSIESSKVSSSESSISSFSSLSLGRIDYYLDRDTYGISLFGKDLTYTEPSSLKEKEATLKAAIEKMIKEGSASFEMISEKIRVYYNFISEVQENARIIDIYKYSSSDKKYTTYYQELYELGLEMDLNYKNYYIQLANSKYRYQAFRGYSDEDIDSYVEANSSEKNSEIKNLQLELTAIQDDCSEMQNGFFTPTESATYLLSYAKKGNELAKLLGYNDYLEYQYTNVFGREYTFNDVSTVYNYMKQYVAPLYTSFTNKSDTMKTRLTRSERTSYSNFSSKFFGPYMSEINEYANFVGGNFLEHYLYLWQSGNYFFSDMSSNDMTAYQYEFSEGGEPFLFFSSGYQNPCTFIHEFGHYNASFTNRVYSYDLMEVQSQADELLFCNYLVNKESSIIENNVRKAVLYNQIQDLLSTCLRCLSTAMVEGYAYKNPDITASELVTYANNVCSELRAHERYWEYTAVYSPVYYISYSMSAFSTLTLQNVVDMNGLDAAKQSYLKCANYPSSCVTYTDVMDYSGLGNPFVETNYQNLSSTLSNFNI